MLLHLLYLALNGLMNRSGHGLAPEEQASVIYNNAGNLILPMVMAILGQEYVIYTSVYSPGAEHPDVDPWPEADGGCPAV